MPASFTSSAVEVFKRGDEADEEGEGEDAHRDDGHGSSFLVGGDDIGALLRYAAALSKIDGSRSPNMPSPELQFLQIRPLTCPVSWS